MFPFLINFLPFITIPWDKWKTVSRDDPVYINNRFWQLQYTMSVLHLDLFALTNPGSAKINNLAIFLCASFSMMAIFGVLYNNRARVKGFWLVLLRSKILSLLKYLYSPAEFADRDACALSQELFGFSLKEDDDWAKEDKSAGNSGSDLKSGSALSNDRKILLQHHTVLDKQMVSGNQSYYETSSL